MVTQSSEQVLRNLIIWVPRLSAGDIGGDGGGGLGVSVLRWRRRGLAFVGVLGFRRIDCFDDGIGKFIVTWVFFVPVI